MSGRATVIGNNLAWKSYRDEFPFKPINNVWTDVRATGFGTAKQYVVETLPGVIERCILMTSDPGDLVFDPTCGSGTTAYVAEQWGRRWITCDTSRVALALARQRLTTATFAYYKLAHTNEGVRGGFVYRTGPRIMPSSIADTQEIDDIYATWTKRLDPVREKLNRELHQSWEEWQVPRQSDGEWSQEAQRVQTEWRSLYNSRQNELEAAIRKHAEQQSLYDQPEIDRAIARVSGPFTVEAVQPPALNPETVDEASPPTDDAGNYLDRMSEQLRRAGLTVRNQHVPITRIAPLDGGVLHAECDYEQGGKIISAAVVFGPQYGPVTSSQLQDALSEARGSYSALIAAGFTFDDQAQALLQKENLRPSVIGVAINADLLMGNLLKTSKSSQVFSVFGKPDVKLDKGPDGFTATVKGVDVYDPNTGEFDQSSADQIAAWFLDTDYDGATFLVSQAYFPIQTPNPWEKISKALKGFIDPEQFAALQRTTSLPFAPGKHRECAVKVIDHRGNEVMTVLRLK